MMSDERWSQIARVCHEALTRNGPERVSYLDSACVGDVDLRREVEALLAQEARADGFLDTPPWESALAGDAGPDTPAGNPAVPDAIDVRSAPVPWGSSRSLRGDGFLCRRRRHG